MKLKVLQWESSGFLNRFSRDFWDQIRHNVDVVTMSRVPERYLDDVKAHYPYFHYVNQNDRDDSTCMLLASTRDIFSNVKTYKLPAYDKIKDIMPGIGSVAISATVSNTQLISVQPAFPVPVEKITDEDNVRDLTYVFENVASNKNCAVIGDFHIQPGISKAHTGLIKKNKFVSHLDNVGTFSQQNDGGSWYTKDKETGKLTKKKDPWEHTIYVTNCDRCLTRGDLVVENIICHHTPITDWSCHFPITYDLTVV